MGLREHSGKRPLPRTEIHACDWGCDRDSLNVRDIDTALHLKNLAEICFLELARNLPSEVPRTALPGLHLTRDTQKPPALHEPGVGRASPIAGMGYRNHQCFGNLPVGPPEPGGENLLLLQNLC